MAPREDAGLGNVVSGPLFMALVWPVLITSPYDFICRCCSSKSSKGNQAGNNKESITEGKQIPLSILSVSLKPSIRQDQLQRMQDLSSEKSAASGLVTVVVYSLLVTVACTLSFLADLNSSDGSLADLCY